MRPRRLLVCRIAGVSIGAVGLMTGTSATAIAQSGAGNGELGTCAAYSGLPSDDTDTSGMAFIRSGTFVPPCAE